MAPSRRVRRNDLPDNVERDDKLADVTAWQKYDAAKGVMTVMPYEGTVPFITGGQVTLSTQGSPTRVSPSPCSAPAGNTQQQQSYYNAAWANTPAKPLTAHLSFGLSIQAPDSQSGDDGGYLSVYSLE
jgi:hypothetical protein